MLGDSEAPARHWLLAVMLAAHLAAPSEGAACSRVAAEAVHYDVNETEAAIDQVPPSPFLNVGGMVWRREGRTCVGGTCTENSCGSSGTLELFFDPPEDDRTPAGDLGFRVVVLEGSLSPHLEAEMARPQPLGRQISYDVGFEQAEQLDATVALIAIDRAGNESAPSAPIHLSFSGCTKPVHGDMCKRGGPFACQAAGLAGPDARPWSLWVWLLCGVLLLRRRAGLTRS